ncbi:Eukaryotic translation initiation factor 3 subunit 4 [Oopsacas minuta]|uniref:Eukaryotic translation initiation factor 3 subunit 4 n=1 Tax=Oopsacas minuta TaxID=111878 RepID=A0AAV7KDV9_9METZ|nr:Eukaryotic translation initiation factor 3 subunit 4 [Oopsacas minuta]
MFTADDSEWSPDTGRIDWADEMDRISPEGKPSKSTLPDSQNHIDEGKGIRTEISYRYNAKNQKEKITRTYKIEKTAVPKGIALRREWTKFGEAVHDKDGVDMATTKESEEICFRLTTNKDELELGIPKELSGLIDKIKDIAKNESKTEIPTQPTEQSKALPGTYTLPHTRPGYNPGVGGGGYNLDDPQPAVKISNLSLDTTEQDVKELLIAFGRLNRLHMPKDRRNRDSHKGVAFATFQRREIGERVIQKLNGHAYDHLILKVEWSKSQRPRN